ncbi:unnamed protein product [Prunus brigantina]
MVHLMTSEDLWPKCHRPHLMLPLYHKKPGRLKKKKMRLAGEQPRKTNPTVTKLRRYNLETKCQKKVGNWQCSQTAQSSQTPHAYETAPASQTAKKKKEV